MEGECSKHWDIAANECSAKTVKQKTAVEVILMYCITL